MRKSKYLVLSGFYFDFDKDLSKIIKTKKIFKNQNILDLIRFENLKNIHDIDFNNSFLNFVYLPENIFYIDGNIFSGLNIIYIKFSKYIYRLDDYTFYINDIRYLDLSKCARLKTIPYQCFYKNNIKRVKLPKYLENIEGECFFENKIESLDLSNCTNLKNIGPFSFSENQIHHLKLPKNIENIDRQAFDTNKIEELNLSNCIKLKEIEELLFYGNNIKNIAFSKNIEIIKHAAFQINKIEILDLSNCIKLKKIEYYAFSSNPLKEIKILGNIEIEYDNYYKKDIWNIFARYYNDNNKKEGNYKLENNEWKLYPL